MPLVRISRAVKMPRSRLPPVTLKPTAFGSFAAGSATLPKSPLFRSSFRLAPLPMNSLAWVTEMDSRSPLSCTTGSAASGSSTPLTWVRLMATVALPKTTSAMLKPTEPPMRKVGSLLPKVTPALPTADCVQSRTAPPDTELRFSWKTRPVPMSFTASTPCNWALPRAPERPVYLRTLARVVYVEPLAAASRAVKMPSFRDPPFTLKPTAFGSFVAGSPT